MSFSLFFIKGLFILSFAAMYDQLSIYCYTEKQTGEREMRTVVCGSGISVSHC